MHFLFQQRFFYIFGLACFLVGAALTTMDNFQSCTTILLPLAAINPDQIQPWISFLNTTLLTVGTSLIVLRQRYLKDEASKQYTDIMNRQDQIKDESRRQHEEVVDGQEAIKSETERKCQEFLEENRQLKAHVISLKQQIEKLRAGSCSIKDCPERIVIKRDPNEHDKGKHHG